jgi:hypothetical protein
MQIYFKKSLTMKIKVYCKLFLNLVQYRMSKSVTLNLLLEGVNYNEGGL